VENFRPDRAQKRCLKRNADLTVVECMPGYNRERHALYEHYLRTRHPGGGMDDADASDFRRFLTAPWSPTLFLELRLGTRLLALAVTDVCPNGISAVYTFYDPAETARSLGTCAILQQIELARRRGMPWLYLGFWIDGHPKMDYKRRFKPLQIRGTDGWRELA
jgi:arginine-tRNA-protein transferase